MLWCRQSDVADCPRVVPTPCPQQPSESSAGRAAVNQFLRSYCARKQRRASLRPSTPSFIPPLHYFPLYNLTPKVHAVWAALGWTMQVLRSFHTYPFYMIEPEAVLRERFIEVILSDLTFQNEQGKRVSIWKLLWEFKLFPIIRYEHKLLLNYHILILAG